MTLHDAVAQAARQLQESGVAFGQGTTNAWDEAAWLVLWTLGLPLDTDFSPGEQAATRPLRDDERRAVQARIEERIRTRQPAAYLTGEAWLQGVPFHVDPRCIVPRSLIAEPLADGTLDAWLGEPPRTVLDLCTGNGSLAVLAALAWPQAAVLATDISPAALEVAALNVGRHGLQDRIRLAQGDAWDAAPGCHQLVLCNPPYVNSASMAELPAEFRAEPELALAGGDDGMDFIQPLLARAASHLEADGLLVLEIGHERPFFEARFPGLQPVWLPTSAGDDQVLLLSQEALLAWAGRPGAPARPGAPG